MTAVSAKMILLRGSLFGAAMVVAFALLGLRGAQTERQEKARAQLADLGRGIEQFHQDTGTLPVSLRELVPRWLPELHKDPWGNDYVFKVVGTRREEDYRVLSLGKDGLLGTDDDIQLDHPNNKESRSVSREMRSP